AGSQDGGRVGIEDLGDFDGRLPGDVLGKPILGDGACAEDGRGRAFRRGRWRCRRRGRLRLGRLDPQREFAAAKGFASFEQALAFDLLLVDIRAIRAFEVFNPVLSRFEPDARVPPRHRVVRGKVEVHRGAWTGPAGSADDKLVAEVPFLLLAFTREDDLHHRFLELVCAAARAGGDAWPNLSPNGGPLMGGTTPSAISRAAVDCLFSIP